MCDENSSKFRDLLKDFDISVDKFSRTSELKHKKLVQNIWLNLKKNGLIKKGIIKDFD